MGEGAALRRIRAEKVENFQKNYIEGTVGFIELITEILECSGHED